MTWCGVRVCVCMYVSQVLCVYVYKRGLVVGR